MAGESRGRLGIDAVELYASQHYTGPWFLKQMLSGGWDHCLGMALTGPNLYGLA
jgi:hypothetical protein